MLIYSLVRYYRRLFWITIFFAFATALILILSGTQSIKYNSSAINGRTPWPSAVLIILFHSSSLYSINFCIESESSILLTSSIMLYTSIESFFSVCSSTHSIFPRFSYFYNTKKLCKKKPEIFVIYVNNQKYSVHNNSYYYESQRYLLYASGNS